MKDVREMFNISYFDNKELSLKEHCDIYSHIKRELISILNKYDIKYVLAETEAIKDLSKENQELKKQLEEYQQELEKADSITQSCIFNGKEESKISYRKCLNILDKKENQQKEFIKWLKDNIDNLREIISDNRIENNISHLNYLIYKRNLYTIILQKYKEIIGDDK